MAGIGDFSVCEGCEFQRSVELQLLVFLLVVSVAVAIAINGKPNLYNGLGSFESIRRLILEFCPHQSCQVSYHLYPTCEEYLTFEITIALYLIFDETNYL